MAFLSYLTRDTSTFLKCMYRKSTTVLRTKEVSQCSSHFVYRNITTEESGPRVPKPVSDKIIAQLREKDNVSKEYELIYRAPRTLGFLSTHCALLITGFSSPVFFYAVAERNDFQFPLTFISEQLVIKGPVGLSTIIGFTASILILAFILVNRFTFRIYCNKKTGEHIAVFCHMFLPWKSTKMPFKTGQVRRLKEPEMIPFQLSNYKINNQKVIFIEEYFIKPVDLQNMLE